MLNYLLAYLVIFFSFLICGCMSRFVIVFYLETAAFIEVAEQLRGKLLLGLATQLIASYT